MKLTRRNLLASAALAAMPSVAATTLQATAPPSGALPPAWYRFKLGGIEITPVHDGVWQRPVDRNFIRNAPFAAVEKALADAFMPADKLTIPFTPLAVNTGAKLVLIDTGSGGQIAPTAGTLLANLAASGIEAKAIDTILISNFHPDHIDGLKTKDNEVVFPNAEIKVARSEWSFWMDDGNLARAPDELTKTWFRNARRIFADIAPRVTQFEPDKELAPGIVAIAAPGHTPGHVAFSIHSGRNELIALCDTTNHPWLFARHPEWQPILDMDGPLAVKTRKSMLDRVAADRTPVTGYHFPFPACGNILRTATGYEFVPAAW